MNDIREQIEWLENAEGECLEDHRPLAALSYLQIRNTMEKLLAVYNAADLLLRIDNPLTNEFMELGKAVADCDQA